MLSQAYPPERLGGLLIPRDSWRPYPTADDRQPWEEIDDAVRNAHLARGENALAFAWPVLPATRFLEFVRTGDRSNYQDIRNARRNALSDLVVAECMEGKGRFVDQIVNGIWATCEETYWGVPAHIGVQKAGRGLPDAAEPTVDLFAAETSALFAWALYLVGPRLDGVSPLVRERIHLEVDRRILTPCLERDDFSWMGFNGRRVNNWNPWICSNWLTSALLVEQEGARRLKSVARAMKAVDNFIDPYPEDGGCDEGPGYWGRAGASLFDCLELLHSATDGALDVYDEPLVQEIGRFIYRVQIAGRYFVNFADASALISPSASLVFRYGRRIGDPRMMALGAWAAGQQDLRSKGLSDSIARQLPALFDLSDLFAAQPAQPLPRDVYLPEIQVMVARDREGSAGGLYVAAKGGHNAESHNHNDVGNVIVYADGKPVLIDAGVGTYTARTFSGRRYEIWTMPSDYHNLPAVNGVTQQAGEKFAAKAVAHSADADAAQFTLDIAGAYPEEAGIDTWVRTVTLNRGQDVVVTDAYGLKAVTGALTLSLLTPCRVSPGEPGHLALEEAPLKDDRTSGTAHLHYDADKLTASTEEIPIEDARLKGVWGERLTRILLRAEDPPIEDTWTIRVTP